CARYRHEYRKMFDFW
nr:immunoglobulin heavy chain junction region [Macaca mulatta]MOW45850.1 immunoglobulin heavy chain junction region [Macaca mulatta]MOW45889.1 immunoglobulin heavy chain junction region [Macaca mulatta]MOW45978.1 immunoglobulin heavy chain junction region [Macaca mulatta]MOW46013.1 immunoglobulin heavy chain junction region [Macaca mulatta]